MTLTWVKTKPEIDITAPLNTYAYLVGQRIDKVVISLHGYGDNAENASHIANAFDMEHVLFLFLDGPLKVPMSFSGRQWFDLFHSPHEDVAHSVKFILDLFHHLNLDHHIPAEKIYFMGFSQGAALAMYCGLQTKKKIGGIVSLSGFMLNTARLIQEQDTLYKECPIYLMHGDEDQTIFPILFFEAESLLKYMGFKNIRVKLYHFAHTVSYEQIEEIKTFLHTT